MKKGKLLILGLIALMLAGGLALASCNGMGTDCEGSCNRKISGNPDNSCQDGCNGTKDGCKC